MEHLIKKTKDLLIQAKTEKSHYYVASVLQKWLEVANYLPNAYDNIKETLPERKDIRHMYCTGGTNYFEQAIGWNQCYDLWFKFYRQQHKKWLLTISNRNKQIKDLKYRIKTNNINYNCQNIPDFKIKLKNTLDCPPYKTNE